MKNTVRLLAAAALGLPAIAMARPADYVRTPVVEYGEREIDMKYGTGKMKDSEGGKRDSAGGFEFGYAVNAWWATEAGFQWVKEGAGKSRYDAFEWENRVQLTELNRYPVDVGLFAEVEIPREHRREGYELAFGPLFQFDTGPLRWNVNPVFEKVLRSREEGPHPLELGYQLQAAYRIAFRTDIGVQAFGNLGKWNDWEPRSDQQHNVGPAIFGKVKLGEGRSALKYNAAFLFGETRATPHRTFRLQAEYEF